MFRERRAPEFLIAGTDQIHFEERTRVVHLMPQLGRIVQVQPREVWPHEAQHFTPWLLENVDVLSDLLGMDLVLEAAEHPVGNFSLDLVGRDEATGDAVIVENQLEVSDHTHLGQIITYAAGTNPRTIIWVAAGFRPEHRAAIDWLNERTDENTRFFCVAVKVVRIGESEPAPNFELAAQPNDWEKQVRRVTSVPSEVSQKASQYSEFWEFALGRIRAEYPHWTRAQKSSSNWVDMPTGARNVAVSTAFARSGLSVQLYFKDSNADNNKKRFEAVVARRDAFEAALGGAAQWDAMDGLKAARVIVGPFEADLSDRESWSSLVDLVIDAQVRIRKAFETVGGPAIC